MEATDKQVEDMRYNLLVMVYQHLGNWDLTMNDIRSKRHISNKEVQDCLKNVGEFVSLIDMNYPERLKQTHKPPFVFFYEGDINVLNESKHLLCVLNDHTASQYATETINSICSGCCPKGLRAR